jgi:hypothetical protein
MKFHSKKETVQNNTGHNLNKNQPESDIPHNHHKRKRSQVASPDFFSRREAEIPRRFSDPALRRHDNSGFRSNGDQYRFDNKQSNRDNFSAADSRSNRESSVFSTYPGYFRPMRDQTPCRYGGHGCGRSLDY